jgi:hypothetical protein
MSVQAVFLGGAIDLLRGKGVGRRALTNCGEG